MKERSFTVIVRKAEEGGFWTEVPALPGAGSQGETVDEALDMTREAIELMIKALEEDGKEVPEEAAAIVEVRRVTLEA